MTPRQPRAVTRRNHPKRSGPAPNVTIERGKSALPPELRDLPGADKVVRKTRTRQLAVGTDVDVDVQFGSRATSKARKVFRLDIIIPLDLADLDKKGIDPLIHAHGVASSIRDLQVCLEELVKLARMKGHSWTRIGEALGMTRQAAWDKYSGEE